jgi:hypothetical protein
MDFHTKSKRLPKSLRVVFQVLLGFAFILNCTNLVAQVEKTKKQKTKTTTKSKEPASTIKSAPLFDSDEVLELKLTTNFKPLFKDRSATNPSYHWAKLEYDKDTDNHVSLDLLIKVRGNFRKSSANCKFPPILLNLPNKKSKNTLFENQNHLKLVTHCKNEDYVYREYLVYKLYNLLTEYSLKARLLKVTYIDSLNKRDEETFDAFILEDEEAVANRTSTKNIYLKQIPADAIDTFNMATLSVFEYMIGNTDWSLRFLHNIKLFGKQEGRLTAMAYDFDHSGIVDAYYAKPADMLDIRSVRDRLYRGITFPNAIMINVFQQFKDKKDDFYALYQNDKKLDEGYVKKTVKFLDEFYETIDDPQSLDKIFIEGGGREGTKNVNIKGLK